MRAPYLWLTVALLAACGAEESAPSDAPPTGFTGGKADGIYDVDASSIQVLGNLKVNYSSSTYGTAHAGTVTISDTKYYAYTFSSPQGWTASVSVAEPYPGPKQPWLNVRVTNSAFDAEVAGGQGNGDIRCSGDLPATDTYYLIFQNARPNHSATFNVDLQQVKFASPRDTHRCMAARGS